MNKKIIHKYSIEYSDFFLSFYGFYQGFCYSGASMFNIPNGNIYWLSHIYYFPHFHNSKLIRRTLFHNDMESIYWMCTHFHIFKSSTKFPEINIFDDFKKVFPAGNPSKRQSFVFFRLWNSSYFPFRIISAIDLIFFWLVHRKLSP